MIFTTMFIVIPLTSGFYRRLIRDGQSTLPGAFFHSLVLFSADLLTLFLCFGGLHSGMMFGALLIGHQLSTEHLFLRLHSLLSTLLICRLGKAAENHQSGAHSRY